MSLLFILLGLVGLFLAWIEIGHYLRPASPLQLKTSEWKVEELDGGLRITGSIEIKNPHKRMEVMVPELDIKPILLGKNGTSNIRFRTTIKSNHPDEEQRSDDYWQAYIVKSRKSTNALITINLIDNDTDLAKTTVENIWIDIHWLNYGPFGRLNRRDGVLVPMLFPEPLDINNAYFQKYDNCQLLPLKTHLLGNLDNIEEVINLYAAKLMKPGDVLTIGETPIAIIQGRYIHPQNIMTSWISRLLCRSFHPTSSLATACGMQSLIDLVGPTRVTIAWLIGVGTKLVGIKGFFYRMAGEQARLIDDITGTTPPYDQTIVLGPKNTKRICKDIANRLGIEVAIVDVNDLGKVKVLASSQNCPEKFVKQALRTNPAGNANEQTPLVIVRPC